MRSTVYHTPAELLKHASLRGYKLNNRKRGFLACTIWMHMHACNPDIIICSDMGSHLIWPLTVIWISCPGSSAPTSSSPSPSAAQNRYTFLIKGFAQLPGPLCALMHSQRWQEAMLGLYVLSMLHASNSPRRGGISGKSLSMSRSGVPSPRITAGKDLGLAEDVRTMYHQVNFPLRHAKTLRSVQE